MTFSDGSINPESPIRCLTARWILTMTAPPQRGGSVTVRDGQILSVDRSPAPRDAIDLGDVALLPGLINAHTHLEFSDLSSPVGKDESGRSQLPLHDWIGKVVETRGARTNEDTLQAIQKGWQEAFLSGTRWLGEIATPPIQENALNWFRSSADAMETFLFCEVIGLSESRWQERLQQADQTAGQYLSAGYSPHAPYSTAPQAWQACIQRCQSRNCMLAMHLAESPQERELIVSGQGALADALQRMGVLPPNQFPWAPSASQPQTAFVPLIDSLAQCPRGLLIHGNDLNDHEIRALSKHSHLSVVYCPRTHWYFGHEKHPVDRLQKAGIQVALGTDSRASNPDLNLWSEVQHLLHHRQDLKADDVLRMATSQGARAVGRRDLGALEPGRSPGFGCVQTQSEKLDDLYRDLACQDYVPLHTHA